jgi:hypothetical protein
MPEMNLQSLWIALVLACLLAVRQVLRVVRVGVKAMAPRQRFDPDTSETAPAQQGQLFRLGSSSLDDSAAGCARR